MLVIGEVGIYEESDPTLILEAVGEAELICGPAGGIFREFSDEFRVSK